MRTILSLLISLFFVAGIRAQNCLPNGITFTSQSQISSFHNNYPGCTVIEGDVIIDPQPSGNIISLNGLSGLTYIGGSLIIRSTTNMSSLAGLGSLDSIGGSLSIFNTWGLTNLSALGSLKLIRGDFAFYDNHGVSDLNGLTALARVNGRVDIFSNPEMTSLNGLNNLTNIGGSLQIAQNIALTSLNGLNGLKSVGGDVVIGGFNPQINTVLSTLAGLDQLTSVGGLLWILYNPALQNVNGLGSLTTVNRLSITNNSNLNSLAGLPSLNAVEEQIIIANNPQLTNIGFLANFSSINAYLEISNNPALANLSALQNVTALNKGFKLAGSPNITSLTALSNVTQLDGSIHIENMNGLSNLQGLGNIAPSNGPLGLSIVIQQNAALNTLDGLSPDVTTLKYMEISNNAILTDLQGLENIAAIEDADAGQFYLTDNPLLVNLNGLQNLTTVSHQFVVRNNASLQSLSGLDHLTTIGSLFLEDNANLTNLNGLSSLTSLGGLLLSGSNNNAFSLSGMTSLGSIGLLGVSRSTQLKDLAGLNGIAVNGSVYLDQNTQLESLNGLQASTILSALSIYSNPMLTSLQGLENVTTIQDGISISGNPLLADLNGLSNLKTLGHQLFVAGNQSLSDCSVLGLCLFINDPPRPDSVWVSDNAPGCNTPGEVSALCTTSYITVVVHEDPDANCTFGFPLADVAVRLSGGAQNELKPSDAAGYVRFRYVDTAPFALTVPFLNPDLWETCQSYQTLTAVDGRDSVHINLFLSPKVLCPELEVKLNLPSNFRGCLVESEVRASVQNLGTIPAQGSLLAVVMPPVFDLLNTLPPVSAQHGDTLYFETGDLAPFDKTQVIFTVKTKCDTFLMGQTLCWEAFAALENPCPNTAQAYSEIKLKAECIGDTIVRLSLKNIGDAPTLGWHEYTIMRNDTVKISSAFSLNAQESLAFDFPAEGATWRMEATKFADGTQTAVAIENCGGLTPGLITAFWLDHGPVEYDFDCRQVVQAYDPNQKTAVPTGTGFGHIISGEQPIFYTIDFQNTGTDTAFRVLLRDQLSDNLDRSTFKPQGASHPCTWALRGKMLEVLFLPIALPDSNANLAASQGYFSFSIAPKQNLPVGAGIYNYAEIVFDFNWPIWTNWVYHQVGQLTVSVDEVQMQNTGWQVLGNPTRDVAVFRAASWVAGEKRFELYDASGRVLRQVQFFGQEFEFQREMLPAGLYFFSISNSSGKVFSGKIVVAD